MMVGRVVRLTMQLQRYLVRIVLVFDLASEDLPVLCLGERIVRVDNKRVFCNRVSIR